MIVTVTLNPAVDLTYEVDALARHATHRVRAVSARPGGKGLNVARVLRQLGEPVLATGLLGGPTGDQIAGMLGGLPQAFVPVAGSSRRTVTVHDGDATGFWEPGPEISAGEWTAFRHRFGVLLREASVAVLSGSLPPGVPAEAYAVLVAAARDAGVPVLLDASGEALRLGLAARPDVAKPNVAELTEFHDGPVVEGAARMRAAGAGAVVASRGPAGLLGVTGAGTWRAWPPEAVAGNPTGAGDACVAALARGIRAGADWPARLADAVAVSAAAVAEPAAGSVHLPTYARLRPAVTVEEC